LIIKSCTFVFKTRSMKKLKSIFRFIESVYKEKCPNCKVGSAFKQPSLFKIPEMNETCGSCKYKFHREPGYFIGAMYLSYGLALLQGGITFLLIQLFAPDLSIGWVLFWVITTFVLFAKKNFKWSRLLYIYIFPW
jgi:hypothetical protein